MFMLREAFVFGTENSCMPESTRDLFKNFSGLSGLFVSGLVS
jgi:hypothetical protein